MSDKSWCEEFYPVQASAFAEEHEGDDIALVSHCLRKWEGVIEKNLKRHAILSPPVKFSGETCALCHVYAGFDTGACTKCPLYEFLGARCDHDNEDVDPPAYSPFSKCALFGDPLPMIKALRGTLEMLTDGEEPPR